MYLDYYSMRREPFTNNPSPDLFFDSSIHAAAWQVLRGALKSAEPFFLLTGYYGTGKTLLCLKAVEWLENEASSLWLYLATPVEDYRELLWRIAVALGLDAADHEEKNALRRRIDQYFEAHPEVVLTVLLDEAQEYDVDLLNHLRLLARPGLGGEVSVRLFLFAHTSFIRRLASPELESLGQRIKRRYHLTKLDLDEAREYIYFRLLESGAHGAPYFTDAAIEELWRLSGGVPRCLNNICDVSLLIGMSRGLQAIDQSEVGEAVAYLGSAGTPLDESASLVTIEPEESSDNRHDDQAAPLEERTQGGAPNSATGSAEGLRASEAEAGHYVMVEEVPAPEVSPATSQGVAESPLYSPDACGGERRGGILPPWGWRLLVFFLLAVVLLRLVSSYFPELSEWFGQQLEWFDQQMQ